MELIKNTRKPTEAALKETATRERVFRVVRHGSRGKGLYSALAGRFDGASVKEADCYQYAQGMVTMDESGNGIYIYLDKDFAIEQAKKMATKTNGRPLAVYSAKPLGEIIIPAGKSKTATCDGVILIDKVTEIPVPKPKPAWKEVTKDVTVRSEICSGDGCMQIELSHGGRILGNLCAKEGHFSAPGLPSTYRLVIPGDRSNPQSGAGAPDFEFRIYKKS